MRDDLSKDLAPEPGERTDPARAAQAAMRPPLPKRFYREASAAESAGGFVLQLDGRPARTPGRRPLALPTRAAAEAVAAEWGAQGDHVDPATMPMTRIANSAIDGVADSRDSVVDDLVRYAGSDLVCYRAREPERLVAAQAAAWDPVLDHARERLGARFLLSEGVVFAAQPEAALTALRARIERETCPFALAALHVMTTLTGSVLIPLAHVDGALDVDDAWRAGHADELYQESIWGEDAEAAARRALRHAEFEAASRLYVLAATV